MVTTVGVLVSLVSVPALASPGDIDTWLRVPEPTDIVVDELGNTYILDAAIDSISIRECDGTTHVIAHDVASDAITVSKDGRLYFIRTPGAAGAVELIEWTAGVETVLERFSIPAGNQTPHVTGMAIDGGGTVYFSHHTHYVDRFGNGHYAEDLTGYDIAAGVVLPTYPWDPYRYDPSTPNDSDACHFFVSGFKIYGYVPLTDGESACGRTWEGHQGRRGMTVSGNILYIARGGDATIDVLDLSTGAYRKLIPYYSYDEESFSTVRPVTISDVSIDGDGRLLVVDEATHTVWRITEGESERRDGDSRGIRIAGLHPDPIEPFYLPGSYTGDGDPALLATFNQPTGITVDENGNILIADRKNGAIRVIEGSGPRICPNRAPVAAVTVDQTEIRGNGSIDIRATVADLDGASDIALATLSVKDSHGREIARFEDFSQVDARTVERDVQDQKLSGPSPWTITVEARDSAGHSSQVSETVSR